jgi:hypothetical protein
MCERHVFIGRPKMRTGPVVAFRCAAIESP